MDTTTVGAETSASTKNPQSLGRAKKLATASMDSFSEKVSATGISKEYTVLISNAWKILLQVVLV